MTWMYVSAMHGNQAYKFISFTVLLSTLNLHQKNTKTKSIKKKMRKVG